MITLKDHIRVESIDARTYFARIGMGLKWYNYEEFKKARDLRRSTAVIGSLPTRLANLLAEDAVETGLAA